MIDVTHDGHDRGTRLGLCGLRLDALQILLDLVFLEELRGVTQLLDHEHRRVLIDRLVDGRHDAHVHEHLDDLGRLDGHLLRELRDRDRLADADLAHDGRGGHLEPVPAIGGARYGPRFDAPFLLVAGADIRRNVQLLPAISRVAIVCRRGTLPRGSWRYWRTLARGASCRTLSRGRRGCGSRRRGCGSRRRGCGSRRRGCGSRLRRSRCDRLLGARVHPLALVLRLTLLFLALTLAALFLLTRPLLGKAARLILRPAAGGLLLLDAAAILRLQPFALATLGLYALGLLPGNFLGFAALLVELILLLARLLLEHVALDVGALLADLHTDGTRAALDARELQLALRLAPQRDAAGCRIALALGPVAAAQMSQQLELRIVADVIIGAFDLDAGLVELHEQPIHRHLQDLCKLGNRHFRHTCRTLRSDPPRTMGPGQS